ncbi:DUF3783 domain-containing protein [candidate division KSB1 bacterium]|nr:DUF3783 domain-containing protein [candidate division KSB1 bacterium]
MTESTFKKVGQSQERMYGEPGLLICGFNRAQHATLIELLAQIELSDLPIVFLGVEHSDLTIQQAFRLPHRSGFDKDSNLPTAIIMSGFTETELHKLISGYKKISLPYPLWASLTPISENWKVVALLNELKSEREAFIKRQQDQSKS